MGSSQFKENVKIKWNNFLSSVGSMSEHRHLAALRDGFALIVPLVIAASVGIICMTFVFGWYETAATSILGWITWAIPGQVAQNPTTLVWDFVPGSVAKEISTIGTFIFYTIWKGIFNFLSIYIALSLSFCLSKTKEVKDPFIASLVGLASFMILSYGDVNLFGSQGILVAIIASFLGVELFSIFEKNKKLELKMPAGVPPAVGRAFSKLFPTIFTGLCMIAIQVPFILVRALGTNLPVGDSFGFGQAISSAIQAPFIGLVSDPSASLSIGIVYMFFAALLWFFGIHGPNVLAGVFTPIALSLLAQNVANKGTPDYVGSAFADGTWDAFVYFGGTGTTLAFVLIGLFISKKKNEREILKFSAAPGVFNINEPIVFGIPMILNFVYAIPYVLINPLLYIITWLAIEKFQLVPAVIVKIPWTSPIGLGGFLATASWEGIVLAIFNFVLAVLIYLPFVIYGNVRAKKDGEELVKIDYRAGFSKLTKKLHRNKNVSDSLSNVEDKESEVE